jgi:hypothetical protein
MTPCAFSQAALGLVNVGGSTPAAHFEWRRDWWEVLLTGSLLSQKQKTGLIGR